MPRYLNKRGRRKTCAFFTKFTKKDGLKFMTQIGNCNMDLDLTTYDTSTFIIPDKASGNYDFVFPNGAGSTPPTLNKGIVYSGTEDKLVQNTAYDNDFLYSTTDYKTLVLHIVTGDNTNALDTILSSKSSYSDRGIIIYSLSSGSNRYLRISWGSNNSTSRYFTIDVTELNLAPNTEYKIVLGFTFTSSNYNYVIYVNTVGSKVQSSNKAFTSGLGGTVLNALTAGKNISDSFPVSPGFTFCNISLFNELVSDKQVDSIFKLLAKRRG